MENNTKIIGCSFDGLKDQFFIYKNNELFSRNFYLADAVLPLHSGGRILVGEEAERSRVSSGFHWPPESQVKVGPGFHIRRVPIAWAWRILIDAKDKFTKWKIATGVSFDITRIIAAHIAERLGSENKKANIIIAIPNHLDEFGQEGLLRDLITYGIGTPQNKPRLIWRPIAASLSWLDKVQHELRNVSKSDLVLIVHIGPESFEFTALHLREKVHNNKKFIIPLREIPILNYSLCGCDWAAELIQKSLNTEEMGTIWQAFTNFPETWGILAQRPWDKNQLPRVLSTGEEWNLWEPVESNRSLMWQLEAKPSLCLNELTKCNLSFNHDRGNRSFHTWSEFIKEGINSLLKSYPTSRIRGVLVSGPLVSCDPTPWIEGLRVSLEEKGIRLPVMQKPSIDSVWVPDPNQDIIAEGAAVYGARLALNEPTYLDTLTQLYILADKRGSQEWIPLLNREELEIEGGDERKVILKKVFNLKRNLKKLDVWLKKERGKSYKKAQFKFPYSPEEDMPLDTSIRVASANGLAQLELIPEESNFLGGQRVFLDYSTMKEEEELPEVKLGFPPVVDFLLDQNDSRLKSIEFQQLLERFLSCDLLDNNYCLFLNQLKDKICSSVNFQDPSGKWVYGRIVNKNGEMATSEGKVILNKILQKFGQDFKRIYKGDLDRRPKTKLKTEKMLFSSGTWVFGATPKIFIAYLKDCLEKQGAASKQRIVYAAGRCFLEGDQIKLIYEVIQKRIITPYNHKPFPLQSVNALWRLLSLREYAADFMEREQANIFVKQILLNMEQCVSARNYEMKFRQLARAFLYILRFRIKEQSFLSASSSIDKSIFNKIIKCLETAQNYYRNKGASRKNKLLSELMDEIKKYMYYEGSANIVSLLDELFGEEDKDLEDEEKAI